MTANTATASEAEPVTRRTIVKGAAWSIPVIAATAASPLAAASGICNIADPISNGLANVAPSGYPTGTSLPGWTEGGQSVVLQTGSTHTWEFTVTLLEPGVSGSYGDFGLKGWENFRISGASVSDSRISVGEAPGQYNQWYRRLTLITDVPVGTQFTVQVSATAPSMSSGNQYVAMNGWWTGVRKNDTCSDMTSPAYVRHSDAGNELDMMPGNSAGDDTLVFFVR